MSVHHLTWAALFAALLLGASEQGRATSSEAERPLACPTFLNEELGSYETQISTTSPEAQRLFDQGLMLSYAFNHEEAERSFRAAIAHDPACAMCYWGLAYVQGPNINAKMSAERVPTAYEASRKALALAGRATERERAWIDALTRRYAEHPPADRAPLDRAYAEAMAEVANRFPDDLDTWTLYAEALMDTSPWNYWGERGQATSLTVRILTALTRVLSKAPYHVGANHFYIHAVEAARPTWGLKAADRLGPLVPGAGHLVHMPSHIYVRLGRYHDASSANERAILADRRYAAACGGGGFYGGFYVPHNYDFLVATSSLEARSALALKTARELAELASSLMASEHGADLQQFYAMPWLVMVRFGLWNELLDAPAPPVELAHANALWHYARSIAFARTGRLADADVELSALVRAAEDPSLRDQFLMGVNAVRDVLAIAIEEASGEVAAERGKFDEAIAHLKRAVEAQDALHYMEPPPWYRSTRTVLGAALLDAGRAAEAERAFREDLERVPQNGFALVGLAQSLERQGRVDAAAAVRQEIQRAWAYADIAITRPRL